MPDQEGIQEPVAAVPSQAVAAPTTSTASDASDDYAWMVEESAPEQPTSQVSATSGDEPASAAVTPAVAEPVAPSPVVHETAPAAEQKSKHTPRLLAMAEAFGIDRAEAEQYDGQGLLRVIELERDFARQQPQQPKVEPEPEEAIDWGKLPDGTPMTEDDHNEITRQVKREQHELKLARKKDAAQLSELQKKLEAFEQRDQQRAQQALVSRIDGGFDALAAEFPQIGTAKDEFNANLRHAAWNVASMLAKSSDPSVVIRYQKQAVAKLLGHPAAEPAPAAVERPRDPETGQFLPVGAVARATSRTAPVQKQVVQSDSVVNSPMFLPD